MYIIWRLSINKCKLPLLLSSSGMGLLFTQHWDMKSKPVCVAFSVDKHNPHAIKQNLNAINTRQFATKIEKDHDPMIRIDRNKSFHPAHDLSHLAAPLWVDRSPLPLGGPGWIWVPAPRWDPCLLETTAGGAQRPDTGHHWWLPGACPLEALVARPNRVWLVLLKNSQPPNQHSWTQEINKGTSEALSGRGCLITLESGHMEMVQAPRPRSFWKDNDTCNWLVVGPPLCKNIRQPTIC